MFYLSKRGSDIGVQNITTMQETSTFTFWKIARNLKCGYLVEPPYLSGFKVYSQSMFGAKLRTLYNLTISYHPRDLGTNG